MIINSFSLANRAIKGTDKFMEGYVNIAEVAQQNAERILDEAKAINKLRKAEQATMIKAKHEMQKQSYSAEDLSKDL